MRSTGRRRLSQPCLPRRSAARSGRRSRRRPARAARRRRRGGGGGRGGGAAATGFFTAVDANKDGAVTRDEMRSTFERWFGEWDTAKAGTLGQEQIATGLAAAMPAPAIPAGGGRGAGGQNQTPQPQHVEAMMAALPATAPAKPKQARKVLVLGKAAGFVHSSIPLAGRTVEELGKKTGAWTTTITYDPADINEQNLKQYDAIFLASTTGAFLDDANDAAATAARRKALLEFVRGGKGLAGIHAATDSYHQNAPSATPPAAGGAAGPGAGAPGAGRAGRGGFGGGRGGAAPLVASFMAQGDKNSDQRLSRDEFVGLADVWYGKLDTANAGRVSQADFVQRFTGAILPPPPPAAALDLRAAASGLHRLLEPAGVHAARARQPGRHLAGVQQDDRRVLQVALEQPAGDHLQDRRAEPPAERAVQEAQADRS